jgi:hypothetical protein
MIANKKQKILVALLAVASLVIAAVALGPPLRTEFYIWRLSSSDFKVRAFSAMRLAQTGSGRAIRPLLMASAPRMQSKSGALSPEAISDVELALLVLAKSELCRLVDMATGKQEPKDISFAAMRIVNTVGYHHLYKPGRIVFDRLAAAYWSGDEEMRGVVTFMLLHLAEGNEEKFAEILMPLFLDAVKRGGLAAHNANLALKRMKEQKGQWTPESVKIVQVARGFPDRCRLVCKWNTEGLFGSESE